MIPIPVIGYGRVELAVTLVSGMGARVECGTDLISCSAKDGG